MKKCKLRFLSALLAVMLCVTAFSIPAFAYGGETTGGIEPETEETGKADLSADEDEANTDLLTDKETAELLSALFGSKVSITATDEGIRLGKAPLHGTDIDLADCPDLGPVLMVLGLLCKGTTVIRNAERLRLKESDRIAAMEAELRACGGVLESDGGTITVQGCAERLHAPAAPLHGHNDHRVVMSLAVLAAAAGLPLTVDDAEAIQKSWPGFFADAAPLGVEVEDA